MNLIKDKWTTNDIKEYHEYLKMFENVEKIEWATNLLRTNLPVLCIKNDIIKKIVNDIYKGNYMEFLDQMPWIYYEDTAIVGYLMCKIKDFEILKKYLDIYSSRCDNWATCDLLKFNIKGMEKEYIELARNYVKSDKTFVRRIGLSILFNYINDNYLDEIFNILDKLNHEEEYYVNMMGAWLLCECYIKAKDRTVKYLANNKTNKFIINKGIQKCRDSRRLNAQEKDSLLKYKVYN